MSSTLSTEQYLPHQYLPHELLESLSNDKVKAPKSKSRKRSSESEPEVDPRPSKRPSKRRKRTSHSHQPRPSPTFLVSQVQLGEHWRGQLRKILRPYLSDPAVLASFIADGLTAARDISDEPLVNLETMACRLNLWPVVELMHTLHLQGIKTGTINSVPIQPPPFVASSPSSPSPSSSSFSSSPASVGQELEDEQDGYSSCEEECVPQFWDASFVPGVPVLKSHEPLAQATCHQEPRYQVMSQEEENDREIDDWNRSWADSCIGSL